jgi:glycogen debranching enzyme
MTHQTTHPPSGPESDVSQFYIPAITSLQERRLRALKHGDTFGLFNHYGDIVPFRGAPDGAYHRDTRHLSRLELRLNDQRPLLLGSTVRDDNAVLAVDLTNSDLYEGGDLVLPRDMLHLRRLRYLWRASCHERLAISNYHNSACPASLTLVFDSDFADLFEARGQVRKRRGHASRAVLSDRAVALRYVGLDELVRATTLRFSPAPTRLDAFSARYDLSVVPDNQAVIFIEVEFSQGVEPTADTSNTYLGCMFAARRALRRASARAAGVTTSNSKFNQLISRSISDLQMLITDTDHGPYPYAGIPWFSTPFGRDGLLTALFTLWLDPTIAKGVLRYLAATQATTIDVDRDAEPGKILHETRGGEMARLCEVPFGVYYGSVDATPLFVVLAGAYVQRTGDMETLRAIWSNVEAALAWIDSYGDADGDGLVEYNRHSEKGLVNQGWKDSHDSVFHADGRLAAGPIALCEVQAYVFLAKRHAAALARLLDLPDRAIRLESEAATLREQFETLFWCDDISTYALALDGVKKPCRVRSSNAGHALFAGIASPERAQRVCAGLLDGNFFAGWGIRTLAASQARYNPMSYHNGSIWPHDNAIIALGFNRYGFKDGILRIISGMFSASNYIDLGRLPELLCGFARQPRTGPTLYPVACAPQAWATATPFALIQAALGLDFDYWRREIRLTRPRLPDFLDQLRLQGVRLGDKAADLRIDRHESLVSVHVPRRAESLDIIVVQ